MQDVTIKVPAKAANLFRDEVLLHLEMQADAIEVAAKRYYMDKESSADELRMDCARLDAAKSILDQIGWERSAKRFEVTANSELLRELVHGALANLGDRMHGLAEKPPVRGDEIRQTTESIEWLTSVHEELVPAEAG